MTDADTEARAGAGSAAHTGSRSAGRARALSSERQKRGKLRMVAAATLPAAEPGRAPALPRRALGPGLRAPRRDPDSYRPSRVHPLSTSPPGGGSVSGGGDGDAAHGRGWGPLRPACCHRPVH